MLLSHPIPTVKSFASQELTVSSPEHLQPFQTLHQENVLSINTGDHWVTDGKKNSKKPILDKLNSVNEGET